VDIDQLGFSYAEWEFIKTITVVSSAIASFYLCFDDRGKNRIPVESGDEFTDMKIKRLYFTNTLTAAGNVVLYLDGVKKR